jgi:hypothetical protein
MLLIGTPIAAQHHGYWAQSTPQGKSFECQLVEDYASMMTILRQAGWDVDRGVPVIDWEKDCAIVIAPDKYYEDGEIAFFGLSWKGDKFLLQHGWVSLEVAEIGGSSATFGSALGTPETIVVSFPHYMHSANPFYCSNIGFQR